MHPNQQVLVIAKNFDKQLQRPMDLQTTVDAA